METLVLLFAPVPGDRWGGLGALVILHDRLTSCSPPTPGSMRIKIVGNALESIELDFDTGRFFGTLNQQGHLGRQIDADATEG